MGIGERLGKTVLNALHKGSAQAQVRSQSQMERSLESLATFRLAGMLQTTPGIDIQSVVSQRSSEENELLRLGILRRFGRGWRK